MILFPQPRSLEVMEGTYALPVKAEYRDLVTFYRMVREGIPEVRVIRTPLLDREEYHLSVYGGGVEICASCDEGLFRAVTSLHQMLLRTGGELPQVAIKDKPAIARRGYMIDISRGKKPRMATIKMMIDYIASLKYNEFQLYMEGDCFKYAAYPKETADFDCLTPENIVELDQYCRDRFIDLVPNQNSFGHMYTWLRKPDFHHLGLFEREDEVPSTRNISRIIRNILRSVTVQDGQNSIPTEDLNPCPV